jgi:hypothetical protein
MTPNAEAMLAKVRTDVAEIRDQAAAHAAAAADAAGRLAGPRELLESLTAEQNRLKRQLEEVRQEMTWAVQGHDAIEAERAFHAAQAEQKTRDADHWERTTLPQLVEILTGTSVPVPARQAVADALDGDDEQCWVTDPIGARCVLYSGHEQDCRFGLAPAALSAPDGDGAQVPAHTGPQAAVPDVPYAELVGQPVVAHFPDGETVRATLSEATPDTVRLGDGEPIPVDDVQLIVPDRRTAVGPPTPTMDQLVNGAPLTTLHDLPPEPTPHRDSTATGGWRRPFEWAAEKVGLAQPDDQTTDQNGDDQ